MADADDLADVQDLIKSGEQEFQHGDRRIKYRTLDDLERIEARLKNQIGGNKGRRRSTILIQSGKGL